MRLTGHTILITGGGSGIGAGLAAALHGAGNRVVIAGRRRDALAAVSGRHPGIEWLHLDQADSRSLSGFADRVAARYPECDVLINNAGVMPAEDLRDPDPEVIEAVCATNLIGPMLLTAHLLPILRRQPCAAIINVSSALAFVPKADLPTYSATKAALHSYSESLRFQLRNSHIQVVEVPPPLVYTDGSPTDGVGIGVDEFVDEVVSLLAHGLDEIVVDAARALRFAERRDEYEKVYATVNPVRGMS